VLSSKKYMKSRISSPVGIIDDDAKFPQIAEFTSFPPRLGVQSNQIPLKAKIYQR